MLSCQLPFTRPGTRLLLVLVVAVLSIAGCSSSEPPALVQKAKQLRERGDRNAAIISLKSALQKDPRHGEARYLLGTLHNETRDGISAEKELRRASELGVTEGGRVAAQLGHALLLQTLYAKILTDVKPSDSFESDALASVYAVRGRAELALGRRAEAEALFATAAKTGAENVDVAKLAFLLKVAERDMTAAATLIDQALAKHPREVELWTLKIDLLKLEKKHEEAIAMYRKLLEMEPRMIPARVGLGSLYLQLGKKEEAQKEVDAARKIARNHAGVNYLQALIHFENSKYQDALSSVQTVLKAMPGHEPSLLLSGAIYHALGSFAQAEAVLSRFLARNPGNLYARKVLAATLLEMKNGKRALEVIEPVLGRDLQAGAFAALAGEAHMQSGEFTKATAYLEKAAAADPRNPERRVQLGLSRLASGDEARAIADLEAAAELGGKSRADFVLVMTLLRGKQFDRALQAATALENKLPKNPIPHQLKGLALAGLGDVPAARKSFEQALAIDPAYLPAAARLAEHDLKDGNVAAARKRFEGVLAKDPKSIAAMTALARVLSATGDRQGALKWLREAVKTDSSLTEVQVQLVTEYLAAGNRKEGLIAAQEAQRARPNDPFVLDALGMAQLGNGEAHGALATFTQMAALVPKSGRPHYRIALTKLLLNDKKGAEESLKTAVKLAPQDREAMEALGKVQLAAGRTAEALATAQRLEKQDPQSPEGLTLHGDALMAQRNYAQALKSYQAAMKLKPSGDLVIKAYMAETRSGNAAAGRSRLEAWVAEHPEDLDTRTYLGDSYLQAGDTAAAVKHYEHIVQRSPDNLMVQNNLANAYHAAGDKRALEVAERAYKLRPDNPLIADTLAWILFEKGDTKRSLELLQKAAAAAPKIGTIRYHLAAVLAKSGDRQKARSEIEKLLASGLTFPERKQAEALLSGL